MPTGGSAKQRRIGELLRTLITAEMGELKDPRLGFVTVTGVEVAPDLHQASVYYSVLGTDEEARETAEALRSATPRIRRRVARQVRLRQMPELRFLVDKSIASGLRISRILAELSDEADTPERPD